MDLGRIKLCIIGVRRDMKKVKLVTMSILLVMSIGVCSCAKKTKQTEVKNPARLLGLSESQLIERLGDPQRWGLSRPELKILNYEDIRFRVYMEDGVVAACSIADRSSVQLSTGIGCGTPLAKVVEQYGPYDSKQEAEDLSLDKCAPRILYHSILLPDTERYYLRYPAKGLLFCFYPNKQVHSITLGKIF